MFLCHLPPVVAVAVAVASPVTVGTVAADEAVAAGKPVACTVENAAPATVLSKPLAEIKSSRAFTNSVGCRE